ncbi:NAD(P)H-dependent oxidoreductase [Helicobacter felis]|uniref:NAD(P)H-dependent oxidoreductase n=1 Tax=Helicobacter felis TaxID=214 RepID=UPI000CF0F44F|nr:NAD(P)H-dependent oxidoreductase [Helicobacter felis]
MLSLEKFHSLLQRRFACKKFDPSRPVAKEVLEEVLKATWLAPSSYNTQPWEFLVLQGTHKDALLPHVGYNAQMIQDASALVVVGYMHSSMLKADYFASFCPPSYLERIGDGVNILLKERLQGDSKLIDGYLKEQCYIAVGQMCLAATLLGVDTCIIGGFDPQGVKQALSTFINPPKIVCLVALGKGAMPPTPKARKPKGSAIRWL